MVRSLDARPPPGLRSLRSKDMSRERLGLAVEVYITGELTDTGEMLYRVDTAPPLEPRQLVHVLDSIAGQVRQGRVVSTGVDVEAEPPPSAEETSHDE